MDTVKMMEWLARNLTLTNVLLVIILGVVLAYITKTPNYLRDKLQKGNSKALQVESFYRQISGDNLRDIVDRWNEQYFDNMHGSQNIDQEALEGLIKETITLASSKTNIYLAAMLQHIYTHPTEDENNSDAPTDFSLMVYMALIVTSLKEDFTGETMDYTLLLQDYLTDFNEQKMNIRKTGNLIKKEIKSSKKGTKIMSFTTSLIVAIIVLVIFLFGIIYMINKL